MGTDISGAEGTDVDTVGRNKERIAEYIRHQLDEDIMADQLSFKEYIDPFTGSRNHQGIRKGRFSGGPRKYCGCWTVQCAFRRGRYHCLEGMVHTTGLAGGFDLC